MGYHHHGYKGQKPPVPQQMALDEYSRRDRA
jgi:hypothetical protein